MSKPNLLKVGIFLTALFVFFSAFASSDKMTLAEKYTNLLYPAEFYGIHGPSVNNLINHLDFKGLKLPQHEKNDLREKLIKMLLTKSIKTLSESRMEVYSEDDLKDLLVHYQSKMGMQIINKAQQSKYNSPAFNQQELDFMKAFQKNHQSLSKKTLQVDSLYRKKFAEKSKEVGAEVAMIVAGHLDAYEKRNK